MIAKKKNLKGLPHGTILGKTKEGIIGYNCNYNNFPDQNNPHWDNSHYLEGIYTGYKW